MRFQDKCVYSGDRSHDFWEGINSIPNVESRDEIFQLACQLQDLEYKVLRKLEQLEGKEQ